MHVLISTILYYSTTRPLDHSTTPPVAELTLYGVPDTAVPTQRGSSTSRGNSSQGDLLQYTTLLIYYALIHYTITDAPLRLHWQTAWQGHL
jgi:hypothetical protein